MSNHVSDIRHAELDFVLASLSSERAAKILVSLPFLSSELRIDVAVADRLVEVGQQVRPQSM